MTLLGQVALGTPGKARVVGSRVFVVGALSDRHRLYDIDVSNPSSPTITTSIDYFGGVGPGVEIGLQGNRLYVPIGGLGISVLDISNPAAPVSVGFSSITGLNFGSISVTNDLAYVATDPGGLRIYDVSNPQSISLVGTAPTGQTQRSILRGNLAYCVSQYQSGGQFGGVLQVVDVSNPVNPAIVYTSPYVGPASQPYYAHTLAVSDTMAIVGYQQSFFNVYSLANPAQPVFASSVLATAEPNMEIVGDYMFSAEYVGGLVAYNAKDIAKPVRVGNFETAHVPVGMSLAGNYVYIRDDYNGTYIVDVSNPAQPTRVATYVPTNVTRLHLNAGPVVVAGNRGYFGTDGGLDVVDLTNPASPVTLGAYRGPSGTTANMVLVGDYIYTSGGQIIDISEASNPHQVASYSSFGALANMQAYGNFIYYSYEYYTDATHWEIGILDVSNPLAPQKRGTISGLNALDLSLSYPYLYASINASGWASFDVSNPDQVRLLANPGAGTGAYVASLAASGTNLFTFDRISLKWWDVTEPWSPIAGPGANPTIGGLYYAKASAAARGSLTYFTAADGLRIYDVTFAPRPLRPSLESFPGGNKMVVRWPKTFADFQLYSVPTLGSGQTAQLVTSNPSTDGDYLTYTNTHLLGNSVFYFLKK